MNLLLDTHALLWALADDRRLGDRARRHISQAGRRVVSAASAWEIEIKRALGKLDAPEDLPATLRDSGYEALSMTIDHAIGAGALPLHHRDPFDRMLIAQARLESLTVVTSDAVFERYGVSVLHASA